MPAPDGAVIYIGGYGRSGSTLLALALSEDDRTLNLGEVALAPKILGHPKRLCTCGATMAACPVWSAFPAPERAGRKAHLELLQAAFAVFPDRLLIDSSKTAFRHALQPGYLHRRLPMRMRMLHVVRDPRAVAWSVLREHQRRGGSPARWRGVGLAARTAAAWTFANLAAEWFGLRHRRDYARFRYEDAVTTGIEDALGLRLPAGPLAGRTLQARRDNIHAAVGNRMRRTEAVTVSLDAEWRTALSPRLSALVSAICLPLMLRYRYLGRAGRPAPVTP